MGHAPIVKHLTDFDRTEVPKRRGIAGDAFFDPIGACARRAVYANAHAALANAEAQPVGRAVVRVMTGRTGNVTVARKDRIEEKQLPDPNASRVNRVKALCRQGRGQNRRRRLSRGCWRDARRPDHHTD